LIVVGDRVLIQPEEGEDRTKVGLYLPASAVDNQAVQGGYEEAFRLYKWFLPLLRMDTVPKFVHLIKLVQQEVLLGNERLRPPKLALVGAEREETLKALRVALESRPS
ncbi:MAG: hypothetical protein IH602_07990, partial [Bryobacteraceae bacterium]|nr:hypothetical protein [Bryobacteraceae bacterium]